MLLLLDALHLRHQSFYNTTDRSSQFNFFEVHPAVTLFSNNQITLCSYYVQHSAMLHELLHTIVDNVMRLFLDCLKFHNTVQGQDVTRLYYNSQYYAAISRSHNYFDKSIDGYFCDNVVYHDILH